MIDENILKRTMEVAEEFFGTQNDPSQIPINFDSYNKLIKLWPGAFAYELGIKGEPISWAVVIPTSHDLMNKFLKKEISEKQLLEHSAPAKIYDCLYLCSAFTLPDFRCKGLALKLLLQLIKAAPLTPDAALFAWPTINEGENILKRIEEITRQEVLRRRAG